MPVKPRPDGYHAVTPYLVVQDAARLIAFTKEAFGAEEIFRHAAPDGSVMHAEVRIGDSPVMMGGTRPGIDPFPAMLYLYVNDTDGTYERALEAGATSIMKPADQFYGDRNGGVKDPFGNQWWIATHVEDVSPEEMSRRAQAKPGGH